MKKKNEYSYSVTVNRGPQEWSVNPVDKETAEKILGMILKRDCKRCRHYTVRDEKTYYSSSGCGTETMKIYGCNLWACHYDP